MASSFVNLTFFLLLAVLTRSAEPQSHEEIKPPPLNTYIVHADHLAKPSPFATHEDWYTSMVATHSPRPAVLLYAYDTVMRGFAVQLTCDEAWRMSDAPGVTGVHEDRVLQLLTTRSPGFLGLDPGFGAWKETDLGDGVIIGFVDTGIWPESRSFNDRGLGPVRPSWKGKCVDAPGFNATSSCNNKIVGAKVFAAGKGAMRRSKALPTPRDEDGHGTHVASTAAGSEVHNIGIGMFARGKARGVAPKARIATYKVASDTPITDVVAAIDAAVKDGVDIISLSIGYSELSPFHNDSFAIAVFGADRKGVFVVLAGGNTGPAASSVINLAPWMTTVGAGTVDRLFPVRLRLGDGTVITGQALYNKTRKSTMTPLLSISCSQPLTPDKIRGGIVICIDGSASDVEVRDAGGAGQIIIQTWNWNIGGTEAVVLDAPGVVLSRAAGKQLRAYMDSVPFPVASLSFTCEMVTGENRAPLVVSFSSRGPNPVVPELLKPDVIAPGQNVLAAWKGGYTMGSGTSMACPHVAGVAALIKKKHPSWTPAMIRSSLMTTAATLDNTGRVILDNAVTYSSLSGAKVATPFAAGAGHVRPQLAMDPGLVYDAGARDYIDFLCALNYTTEQLRRFAPDMATCNATALPGGPADLNYPSFVVLFDNHTDARTLTRTVTKVSQNAETYNVTIAAPEMVKVTVTPTTLEFNKHMETRSYIVEFRSLAGGNLTAGWDFGHIVWENEDHQVTSPVAFQWNN